MSRSLDKSWVKEEIIMDSIYYQILGHELQLDSHKAKPVEFNLNSFQRKNMLQNKRN